MKFYNSPTKNLPPDYKVLKERQGTSREIYSTRMGLGSPESTVLPFIIIVAAVIVYSIVKVI
jgi:hypothetical protein